MKYLCTREEMQQIDAYSIEKIGIPGLVLMEKAAMAVRDEITNRFSSDSSVLIVVEKGNNGGDGLALGRLLMADGYTVTFYEIGGVRHATDSYEVQKNILLCLGAEFAEELPEKNYHIYVDAIFGVGLKREVGGVHKEVIDTLNEREGYKIAVDVPSGVDASTGQVAGTAFVANLTVTFGLGKVGLVLYPGADMAGEVVVKDIGFPKRAVEMVCPSVVTFEKDDLRLLPLRKARSNKGTYGRVLLIAGSVNMAGAAYLCALAAYKSGCGLVRIFTCEENRVIMQQLIPEAIMTTYSSVEEALSLLPEALSWANVAAIGPGLSVSESSEKLLREVLRQGDIPLVVDADAINTMAMLKKDRSFLRLYREYDGGMILTPHLMEMSRLTGMSVGDIQERLVESAKNTADRSHIYVLKDARTVVSDGAEPSYINMSGNHGMAVGGSGDILTGIIAGFLAGGLSLRDAARLGVYCHGLAGDEAVKECGYYGLSAKELPQFLSKVIH